MKNIIANTLVLLVAIGLTVGLADVMNPEPHASAITESSVSVSKAPVSAPKQEEVKSNTPVVAPIIEAPVQPQEDYEGEAKAYIYQHESGNVLGRVNSIGCYGLGQDCNNVLATECPDWQTDRPCQDAFWEKYMLKRYGSWTTAKAFWDRTDARPYAGHWW